MVEERSGQFPGLGPGEENHTLGRFLDSRAFMPPYGALVSSGLLSQEGLV